MATPPATVVVTGASGNLGRAVAAAFGERGDNLALIAARREPLAAAFGGDAPRRLIVPANLLDRAQVDAAVASILARFGRIDVLCNLAGGFRMGALVHEASEDDWSSMFDINVRTVLNMVRAVVPSMLSSGGGRIINVGASSAQKGAAQMGAYIAAKSAVIRITDSDPSLLGTFGATMHFTPNDE